MNTVATKRPLGTRWCKTGITLAVIAAVLTAVGLIGGRTGWLSGVAAFSAFGLGGLIFLISIVVNLIGLALSKGTAGAASATRTVVALLAGVVVIGAAMSQRPDTSGAPAIHDVTSDLADPPEFVAAVAVRGDAPNPPDYLDDGTAEQQRAAYPDIDTLVINMPPVDVFEAAQDVARDMGWEVIDTDLADGRIEATDTTYWFSFKDDVVVRILGSGDQTLVDVRSKSRVGKGDMGTNAQRVRTFLQQLATRTGG